MLSAAFIFSFSNNYSVGYFSCGEREIINQAGGEGGKKWGKSINRASKNQSSEKIHLHFIENRGMEASTFFLPLTHRPRTQSNSVQYR